MYSSSYVSVSFQVLTYASATSARSSERSRSPSRITSLRATCRHSAHTEHDSVLTCNTYVPYLQMWQSLFGLWNWDSLTSWCHAKTMKPSKSPTSSYLRSASSAMCLASFSCISWISIFSSSLDALFSMTFIPLMTSGQWTSQKLLYNTCGYIQSSASASICNMDLNQRHDCCEIQLCLQIQIRLSVNICPTQSLKTIRKQKASVMAVGLYPEGQGSFSKCNTKFLLSGWSTCRDDFA